MKKPSWWQVFKTKLSLGVPFVPTEYLGRCDEVYIKYKDVYLSLLVNVESGEIASMGWVKNLPDRVPLREVLTVK